MDVILSDKIDNLSSLVEYYGGGIKSIQRGWFDKTLTAGQTTTIQIAHVDPAKSDLSFFYGHSTGSGSVIVQIAESGDVLTATNKNSINSASGALTWQVVEYL